MADTTPSKVRFGLKKAYFAVYDEAAKKYEAPWANPGAEALDVSSGNADKQIINADDRIFYSKAGAGSKQLDLTVTRFSRDFYTKILGQTIDPTTGGLLESPDDIGKTFAFMFEVGGDQGAFRVCYFGCTSTVPTYSAGTNTDSSITESAEKATLSASAVTINGKACTVVTCEPGDAGYDKFFTAVPLPGTASA